MSNRKPDRDGGGQREGARRPSMATGDSGRHSVCQPGRERRSDGGELAVRIITPAIAAPTASTLGNRSATADRPAAANHRCNIAC
jgi:hypothetical protein